jgi:hypothetical protein
MRKSLHLESGMPASPEAMRQVWITRYGPPEVLEVREAAVPEPGDNEVLIKVAAAGVTSPISGTGTT